MKRVFVLTFMVLATGSIISATGVAESASRESQPTAAEQPQMVRIGTLRGPTSVGMAPLLAQPDRLRPALEPRFSVFGTPDLLVSQLLAGELDIAALPTNLAANLYNRGAGIQLLAVSGGGVLYVIADRALEWSDLRGRTAHTLARGTTPDILFQALARREGLEPGRDFELRYSADQTELAQQLIAGRLNLAVLPEPFVTRVISANPDLRVAIDLNKTYREHYGSNTYPMTSMVVTRDFAERFPAAVQSFADAYAAGLQWFEENRLAGAEAAAEQIGIPAPIIVEAFDRLNMVYAPAAAARTEVEQLLRIFHEFNPQSVGGRVPDRGFYRN